jgi:hypothetical protein
MPSVGLAPSLLPRLGAVAISVTTAALVCGDLVIGWFGLCFVAAASWRRVRGPGVRDTTILL